MATTLRRVSSFALFASGVAGITGPDAFAEAIDLPPVSSRGRSEARVGLGGTFAGLGGWAVLRNDKSAGQAVAATWLGAAATRLLTLALDDAERDWTFWAYLAGEIGLGVAALTGG